MLGAYPTIYAQCITCVDDNGKPLAGVLYDAYNGVSINVHIWVEVDAVPSKDWFAAIFDYPFNKLGVKKLLGQVAGNNDEALRLDKHFGFIEEGRIKDYSENGDLVLLTMTKDQCRVLNSPRWAKVVRRVEAA
jgi:hypothetical protein